MGLSFEIFRKDDTPEFKNRFHDSFRNRAHTFLKSLSILAAILYPLFGILDHVLYPDVAFELNMIRVGITPLIVAVMLFTFWKKSVNHVNIAGVFLYQIMAFGIDLMVYYTGGVESRYYSGVTLVLVAMFMYMPWSPIYAGLNALAIYLVYMLTLTITEYGNINYNILLSNSYFIFSTIFLGSIWKVVEMRLLVRELRAKHELSREKNRSDNLLLNILPVTVAQELKENDKVQPIYFNNISVMFTDFVNFTGISAKMSPQELLHELDGCFHEFDNITGRYGLEKLKTIGDSYMCASGIPIKKKTHAINCVLAALDILRLNQEIFEAKKAEGEDYWGIRIGIHSGPVVAGVTGSKKFAYDIWGDTVNTASRMESSAEPNEINISRSTYLLVKDFFECNYRGKIQAKGKGEMKMYTVTGLKSEYYDASNKEPNVYFFRKFRSHLVYGR